MRKILVFLAITLPALSLGQDNLVDSLSSLYQANKYEEILGIYNPDNSDYLARELYYFGMAHYMINDDQGCVDFMDRSIAIDNTDPDPHYIKGMALNYMNEYTKAIPSFKNAINLNDSIPLFYSGLGDSFYYSDQSDSALIAYLEATNKETKIDRPFIMIPQIYAEMNLPDSALSNFYRAKENISVENDNYPLILYNIGLYEYLNENYEVSEINLLELLSMYPEDNQAKAKLIQIYYARKEYEKTAAYREQLYAAWEKNELPESMSEMFCFDQFDWTDKRIMVFERFLDKPGELYYKHMFYVVEHGKIIDRIQTENSPIAAEISGLKWAVGRDKGDSHYTFGFFKEDFDYEELKAYVIKILDGEVGPSSSSTFAPKKEKKKKKKKKK